MLLRSRLIYSCKYGRPIADVGFQKGFLLGTGGAGNGKIGIPVFRSCIRFAIWTLTIFTNSLRGSSIRSLSASGSKLKSVLNFLFTSPSCVINLSIIGGGKTPLLPDALTVSIFDCKVASIFAVL